MENLNLSRECDGTLLRAGGWYRQEHTRDEGIRSSGGTERTQINVMLIDCLSQMIKLARANI